MEYQFISTNDVNLIVNTFDSAAAALDMEDHIFWSSEKYGHPLVTKEELASIGDLYLGTNCGLYYSFQCAAYGNTTCSNFTDLEEAIQHLLTVGFEAIVGVKNTETNEQYLFCDLAKQTQVEENVLLLRKSYEYLDSCEGKQIINACQYYKVQSFYDLPEPRCLYSPTTRLTCDN